MSSMPLSMQAGGVEQHLVLIGVELAYANPPPVASRQSVSEIQAGKPETLSKASTWPLLAAMNRSRSSRGRARKGAVLGSSSAQDRRKGVTWRVPAPLRQHDHRIGAAIA